MEFRRKTGNTCASKIELTKINCLRSRARSFQMSNSSYLFCVWWTTFVSNILTLLCPNHINQDSGHNYTKNPYLFVCFILSSFVHKRHTFDVLISENILRKGKSGIQQGFFFCTWKKRLISELLYFIVCVFIKLYYFTCYVCKLPWSAQ